jgi:hypothetical protein
MIAQTIADNPSALVITRPATTTNAAGATVEDPFGAPTTTAVRARLAPLPYGVVQQPEGTAAGVGVPDRHFALVAWDADLREGDAFTFNGRAWKTGPVENIYRFGGVVGKQAPARRAEAIA